MTLAEAPRPEIHPEAVPVTRMFTLPLRPSKCMAKDNSHFAIKGAYANSRGLIAATDGKMLIAAVLSPSDGKPDGGANGIVATGIYPRTMFNGASSIRIGAEGATGIGKNGAKTDGEPIEGPFPPFVDVIPQDVQVRPAVTLSVPQLRAMLDALGNADAISILLHENHPATKPVCLVPQWIDARGNGYGTDKPRACVGVMMPVSFIGGKCIDGKDETPQTAYARQRAVIAANHR